MAKEFNLTVYYFSDVSVIGGMDRGFGKEIKWDTPLLEGYSSIFLRNYSNSGSMDNRFLDAINPGIFKTLWNDSSKIVIVNGWSYLSNLLVIFWARLLGKKIWLRAENTYSKEIIKPTWIRVLKRIILDFVLFRLFINRCLYIGTDSKNFFKYYGIPDSKLIYTPYSVDNEKFLEAADNLKSKQESQRLQLGLPARELVILYTGKFMPVKRPVDLLKAFELLQDTGAALVMVGDGELRDQMESYIKDRQLKQVYLTGFVNQSKIVQYYAVADIFVLCSESETWGLSVNEAMNFSLPIVVSDTIGCAKDLVFNDSNGFIFRKGDITALKNALLQLIKNKEFRLKAGKKSKDIILNFNFETIISNLKTALYSI